MSVRIITDSASDILPSEAAEWGVQVLALPIRFGDEEFLDGETISREEFYNRLIESDELPKTSQITPYRYEQAFEEAVAAGDDVVCLVMTSKLSGSYQSAMLAAAEYPDRVHVVDTQQICGSMYILVRLAALLKDAGKSAADIARILEKQKKKVHVVAVFDTLEYLRKGGRISSAAAIAGGLLSVKPVVTVEDGVVKVIGKARGSKKGNNMLMSFVEEHGGIDEKLPIVCSWSGLSDTLMKKYIADSSALYGSRSTDDIPISHVGATIGTYAGPGAIAFAFFEKQL